MDKEELRTKFKEIRLAMPPTSVEAGSRIIRDKLMDEVDWAKITTLHVYSSIADLNEVDTADVIKALRKKRPEIRITIAPADKTQVLPTQKFDLIIVPTLAFDKKLYRLGWGGGWYDRFLVAQPQASKVGLCFSNGRSDKIPAEKHDIPLDQIITEV